MEKKNCVFIAKSLDGFIADKKGSIDWLNSIPNPEQIDMGYSEFMNSIDAIIMGRNTFETVCSFNLGWPYTKPVFVLSSRLTKLPKEYEGYEGQIEFVRGDLKKIMKYLNKKGFNKLYIDGGKTIQNFLKEDLIDEMTITTLPILLGGGSCLFGELEQPLIFEHIKSEIYLNAIVQNSYKRIR